MPIAYEDMKYSDDQQGENREQTEKLLQEHNISGTLEALTESEGRAIARFKSFDTLRTRLAEEGRTFFSRVNQEEVPSHQVRLSGNSLAIERGATNHRKELLWDAAQSHPESPGGKPAFASAAVTESDQPTPNAKQTNSSLYKIIAALPGVGNEY